MPLAALVAFLHLVQIHLSFPHGPVANEEIALRWLHFIFGIIWIGLLYFFNLVGFKTMGELDAAVRAKVFSPMMARAMGWFRWSALVTVVVGLRYFWLLLAADATNSGDSSLALSWLGKWLVVWLVAYALIYFVQLPRSGGLDNNWIRAVAIAIVIVAASYASLVWERGRRRIQRAFVDRSGWRNRPADAAKYLGRGVARSEALDNLDAREGGTRNADAAGSGSAITLELHRFSRRILAFVSDAFLHGRRGALPVSQHACKVIAKLLIGSDLRCALLLHVSERIL